MKRVRIYWIRMCYKSIWLYLLFRFSLFAQCIEVSEDCEYKLFPFAHRGHYYRAELFEGESAKLKIMLYSGFAYRIVPCSDKEHSAIFELYDPAGVLLFSNREFAEVPYWDLEIGASGNYTIVGRRRKGDGCLVILIGKMDRNEYEQRVSRGEPGL